MSAQASTKLLNSTNASNTTVVDPTDVPPVCPAALGLAMALRSAPGPQVSGAPDLGTIDDEALADIEAALWSGGPLCAERTAVMLRLRALAEVLTARRFAPILARRDQRTFAAALKAAATLRLNAGAGLNPVRMMSAMVTRPAPVAVLPTRPAARDASLPLAA